MRAKPIYFIVFAGLLFASAAYGQFDESLLKNFTWRSLGPVGAGGRVVDFAVAGEFPHRIYVATASGGLWKTTNNGVTWEPIFDSQSTISIGDVAVVASSPDTIWVGTGEANGRNSVSWGDGVYKSTDGGKTWTNTGLRDSHHIGRIVIDPRDPDTVYVAALGHLWGPNKERGLYKTTDGGKTWTRSLCIDENTGVVDLAMDPHDSNTLYAAAYQRRRDGYSRGDPAMRTGPGSGLYKTTDGGRTWKKLTSGLPSGDMGRLGIDISRSNPSVVYAIIETPTTTPPETPFLGDAPPQPPPGPKTMKDGGVFRSDDRGETWRWMNPINPRPFYYSQVRADPTNENRLYVLGGQVAISEDGGKTFRNEPINVHVDHHALWIDPNDPRHLLLGNDGGIYFTYDGGKSWDFLNQIAIGQFYAVDVDMRKPYYIYGGVQDYCSWGGPSATRNTIGITAADWFKVQTGDGFQVRIDPTDHTIIYAESQHGGLVRHDLKTGRNTGIKPQPEQGEKPYRFNWETPILISPHDPHTLYVGGNFVFKSTNRGDAWSLVSPELTTENVASITTVSESPRKAGLLYAGTDDGNVHVTRDGGRTWRNITDRFPGMPGKRWASRVVASRFHEGTAFVTFDGHRSDDLTPYVFKTTDYGETWRPIRGDLPASQPVRVIREDTRNRNLLFLGTEFAAYVSIDGGAHWVRLMNKMPTVAVADLVIHPRDGDLIAGTHGRSVYVMDISPIQELNEDVLSSEVHLFNVKPALAFNYRVFSDDQFLGEKRFVAENAAYGATISYYLKTPSTQDVKVTILDKAGNTIRELSGSKDRGIQRVNWDLRSAPPPQRQGPPGGGGGGFGGPLQGPMVEPGEYVARLTIGSRQWTTPVVVEPDPMLEISEEGRKRLRTTITSLLRIQSTAHSASTTVDSLKTQLDEMAKWVAELGPAAVKTLVDSTAKQADELRGKVNRANGRVLALYREVTGSPFAPTATQVRELDELSKELDTQVAALNQLISNTIPDIERQMNRANVPRLKPVTPIARPR